MLTVKVFAVRTVACRLPKHLSQFCSDNDNFICAVGKQALPGIASDIYLTQTEERLEDTPSADGAGHDDDPQEVGGERDAAYQRHEGVRVKHRRAAVAVPVRGRAEQAGQLSGGDQVRHVRSH